MWRGLLSLVCWLLLYACLFSYAMGCMPFAFPYHRYEGVSIWAEIGRTQAGGRFGDSTGLRSGSEELSGAWATGVQLNWSAVYRDEEEAPQSDDSVKNQPVP